MPPAIDPAQWRARLRLDPHLFDRHRVIGLTGAAALAIGGLAAGALPVHDPFSGVPLVRQLRRPELGAVALVIAYGGLALLVVAWLFLGRLVGRAGGPSRRSLLTTLTLWAVPLALAPPMFSRDVYSYAAQGYLVRQGTSPYFWGPAVLPGSPFLVNVPDIWSHARTPYSPAFLWLARYVVDLGQGRIVPVVLGFRLLSVLGLLLLARYVPRLARHCGVHPDKALWLGVLNPLVLVHFVSGAHNDALMVGLMVAGLVFVLDHRGTLGVAVCALAVMIKAPAALALVFMIPLWAGQLPGRARIARAAAGTLVVAGGVVAGVTWLTGLGFGWVGALQTPGAVRNWLSPMTMLGEAGGLLTKVVGLGDSTDRSIALFRGVGGLAALLACLLLLTRAGRAVLARSQDAGSARAVTGSLGLALTAVVLLSPVVQPWYLLWGFVFLAAGTNASGLRNAVIAVSAALAVLVMPKGGTVDVSAIVQAALAAMVVVASATIFEILPLAAVRDGPPAGVVTGTRGA